MVLPGFVATEGFPATELRQKALTRWIVSKPEAVAEAIVAVGPGGRAERYVPRPTPSWRRCASSLPALSGASSPAVPLPTSPPARRRKRATERPHWKRSRLRRQ